jgi:hypothetical protein
MYPEKQGGIKKWKHPSVATQEIIERQSSVDKATTTVSQDIIRIIYVNFVIQLVMIIICFY